jgi:hypothetical protein
VIRRVVSACLISLVLLGTAAPAGAGQDDTPAPCRTILRCTEDPPRPQNPGDRGGYAQLLTLAVLASGVGFIMIKVFRAGMASQADLTE